MFNRIAVVVFMMFALQACSDLPPKEVAEQIAVDYYHALAQGDTSRALHMFSRKQRPGKWAEHLKVTREALGKPTAYQLKSVVTNSPYRGRFYTLDFNAKYSGGQTASETLTLYNNGDDQRVVIVSHQVVSQSFKSPL
ncbi:hypothetical protein ACFL2V_12900 [Pseudomonadota bacterium]